MVIIREGTGLRTTHPVTNEKDFEELGLGKNVL